MAKLYPPYIEGKLPAFTGTAGLLVVPFSMNRAVGSGEIMGIQMQIKYVNRDVIILSKSDTTYVTHGNCSATFKLTSSELALFTVGQYYRVQLAYIDKKGVIGYYSSIGVIKYTTPPTVTIEGLSRQKSNKHTYDYVGVYHQNGDVTEKLYTSRLKMWDSDYNILYDSGSVLHSTKNDVLPNEAIETFSIPFELEIGKSYKLRYETTSINGLVTPSTTYRITASTNGGVEFESVTDLILTATNNYKRGVVELTLRHKDPVTKTLKGMFLISRTEDKEPREWKHIRSIFMTNDQIKDFLVYDYTIEQGKTYLYAIQQYNNYKIYSNRSISNAIYADFEDYYIIDKVRQLKIRFNPHISSMSNTIIETKMDTIGSRYPYITRSGVVNYKAFSLSGLVSYHMDDDEDFVKWADLGLINEHQLRASTSSAKTPVNVPSYHLTSDNISAERQFKLEVLDWLTNGEPKVLKSPTEGNYIVAIMNVNMSPNDTVGRMLHTFNCQAYEIAPFDYEHLDFYDFFDLQDWDAQLEVPQWKTINLSAINSETGEIVHGQGRIVAGGENITVIDIKGMQPHSVVTLGDQEIEIGATGAYYAEVDTPIGTIAVPEDYNGDGSITYQTSGPLLTDFDHIQSYDDQFYCGHQFIGKLRVPASAGGNIIASLSTIRDKMVNLSQVRLFKRPVMDVYMQREQATDAGIPQLYNTQLYYDAYGQMPFDTKLIKQTNNGETTTIIESKEWINTTSLFKISWTNFSITDDNQKLYHDMRVIPTPTIEFDDGSVTERDEFYYVDVDPAGQVIKQYPVYSGYYYDPITNLIIEDDFDLYTAMVTYIDHNGDTCREFINLDEKEFMTLPDTFIPNGLYINDGLIADCTYNLQTIIYSYETNPHQGITLLKNKYDTAYDKFIKFITWEQIGETIYDRFIDIYSNTAAPEAMLMERTLLTNELRQQVKDAYNTLVGAVSYAIENDLTRGSNTHG